MREGGLAAMGDAPCVSAKTTWRNKCLFIVTFISHK